MAEILVFPGLGYECNSYLIVDEMIVLIDTGTGSNPTLKQKVSEKTDRIDLIINTHAHLDHVGGNSLFSSKVAIHKHEVRELESGSLYGTADLFGKNAKSSADRVLKDGDIVETGALELKVIHTPGHTPGGICLLSSEGHLFSGDTVFSGGSFGRVDLPGGSARQLVESLERLKNVDFEFLMPGHMKCVKDGKKHLEATLALLGEMYERR
jgi:glyoxylase-like metal-dependent hydrolase (beta-lactamase superfamily II)